jgi:DNA-binding YbaB/EbfC family protein
MLPSPSTLPHSPQHQSIDGSCIWFTIPATLSPNSGTAPFEISNLKFQILMNIAKLMKQAQQMQAGLAAKQEELSIQTVEASVGGGKVHVIATCAGDVLSIKIDPSVIDPSDAEFLEDLVLKGVQEAIAKGKEKSAAEMKKLTGGLNIPGM